MFKVELTQIALFDEQIDKATVAKIDWRGGAVIRFWQASKIRIKGMYSFFSFQRKLFPVCRFSANHNRHLQRQPP